MAHRITSAGAQIRARFVESVGDVCIAASSAGYRCADRRRGRYRSATRRLRGVPEAQPSLLLLHAPAAPGSPVDRPVVLEESAPDVGARVEPVDDRIDDAGGAVDDVERRPEAVLGELLLG